MMDIKEKIKIWWKEYTKKQCKNCNLYRGFDNKHKHCCCYHSWCNMIVVAPYGNDNYSRKWWKIFRE